MATVTGSFPKSRNSILRLIGLGGLIIGLLHLVIEDWLVFSLLGKTPLISIFQFVASGALGNAAFAGGLATALLGLLIHFLISFVAAGVFILSASRIPLLRRFVIPGSLLYGFGVFVVMYIVALPLSAAPSVPVQTAQVIEIIIEHILVIGLPLGILVQRNTKREIKNLN